MSAAPTGSAESVAPPPPGAAAATAAAAARDAAGRGRALRPSHHPLPAARLAPPRRAPLPPHQHDRRPFLPVPAAAPICVLLPAGAWGDGHLSGHHRHGGDGPSRAVAAGAGGGAAGPCRRALLLPRPPRAGCSFHVRAGVVQRSGDGLFVRGGCRGDGGAGGGGKAACAAGGGSRCGAMHVLRTPRFHAVAYNAVASARAGAFALPLGQGGMGIPTAADGGDAGDFRGPRAGCPRLRWRRRRGGGGGRPRGVARRCRRGRSPCGGVCRPGRSRP